jgi:uncharacterized protein (TIGR03437 family)
MKYLGLLFAAAGLACAAEFATGQAARLVIGQETFTSQLPGATDGLVGAVSGVAYANNTLFVVDSSRIQANPQNNRVLIYNNLTSKLPDPLAPLSIDRRCNVCGGVADVVLGQPDFSKTDVGLTQRSLRTPTAVATDGRYLAVADTDNNRVLIWNSIPATNAAPADVVIGQPDFTSGTLNFGGAGNTPSSRGLRGPQGVWIQDGRLYVADTQNHRVLIWNRIPNQNGQAADVVLGKPDFTTFVEVDLTKAVIEATASTMLNPVSVTSDGLRLYVTDLGHNRVLIWNSIPTQNAQPADIALGQPDVTSTADRNAVAANNSPALCESNGTDSAGKATYPPRCAATMDFPRFALSDGTRLFVADGGNDRVLVYNTIPTNSGTPADVVLGQLSDQLVQDTNDRVSAADNIRTPMSLAWDGVNLYVSDPFNRRVLVFTVGDQPIPYTGIRNAASQDIFAVGVLQFDADPKENDEVTLKIGEKEYKYKAGANQNISHVITGLVEAINGGAGDPLAFANPNISAAQIILTAKASGDLGNSVAVSMTFSSGAQLGGSSPATLSGGQDAARIAPGTLVILVGDRLADTTASAGDVEELPTSLGGAEVYFDGIPAPLLFVSPTQINAQMPFDVNDAYSVSAYVRTVGADGKVRITNAIAVPIIPQNPGIFAEAGLDPRPAVALHGSSFATGVVSVDGSVKANDTASVFIEDRGYNYTVKEGDTLATIRDALISAINGGEDEKVNAKAAAVFTRIVLEAKVPGQEGEGIAYSAKANDGASVIMTALGSALCCASTEGTPITESNPAKPGETILIYATGLGIVQPDEAKFSVFNGRKYRGPELNAPNAPVDSIAGGKTANVLYAGLKPGMIGVYELRLQLNPDIPTNPQTQLTIAQDIYISNIVTFPVVNPSAATSPEPAP